MIICLCNGVSENELRSMVEEGVDFMEEVCTGCGRCEERVIEFVEETKKPQSPAAFSTKKT